MGEPRQEVKRPKKQNLILTSTEYPNMISIILGLKMVHMERIRQRHQFETFVRSVALVELGKNTHLNLAIFLKNDFYSMFDACSWMHM